MRRFARHALSYVLLVGALLTHVGPPHALAEDVPSNATTSAPAPPPVRPWQGKPWARTIGLGVLGALTGFVAHESGHIAANLLLGNVPHITGTRVFGWLPFPVISPGIHCEDGRCTDRDGDRFRPGPRGDFFIVTAGFHVQHATDEILLSRQPDLMRRYAPFQKGLLLFNVFLSGMYAVGAYTGLEDPHGDLANAARASGIHSAWLATVLLMPAALDTYRFFAPGVRWAPWASRGSKTLLFGLNWVF